MGPYTLKAVALAIFCLLLTAVFYKPSSLESTASQSPLQTADAVKVQAITVVPKMAAYGQARPERTWAAVSQADSRLIWVSPKIAGGESVAKGEELLHLLENSSALAGQKNSAERTVVLAPFKGLVIPSDIESGQQILSGQTMLTMDSMDKAEITIGLNSEKMAMLADMNQSESALTAELKNSLSQAWVEVAAEGDKARTPARLSSRPVSMSPKGLIEASLIIDNPSSPGTLHQVFISGPPRTQQVVIPRRAVHNGEVFVVDEDLRLKKRQVKIRYNMDNYTVIGQGLKPGETLIIGDVGSLKPGDRLNVNLDDQFYLTAESDLGQKNIPLEGMFLKYLELNKIL